VPIGERLGTDDFREKGLRRRIAVQDAVLAALLVIDDELHGDARTAGQFAGRRPAAIADHVAGVGAVCVAHRGRVLPG
jgi:hypothetical protein